MAKVCLLEFIQPFTHLFEIVPGIIFLKSLYFAHIAVERLMFVILELKHVFTRCFQFDYVRIRWDLKECFIFLEEVFSPILFPEPLLNNYLF